MNFNLLLLGYLKLLKKLQLQSPRHQQHHPFYFASSDASVAHNTALLEANDYDLSKIIDANQDTSLGYGSEFRSIEDLKLLYHQHELFPFFTEMHQQGMEYVYDREFSEVERMAELSANLARGNQKTANSNPEELKEKMKGEVQHGFALPVWTSVITKIPKAMLQACNLVSQWTMSKTGERKKKS